MYLVIIIIILGIFLYKSREKYKDIKIYTSDIDKRNYNISTDFNDYNKAADTMAKLHDFIIKFLNYLKFNYIDKSYNNSSDETINYKSNVRFIKRILNNYNPDNLHENNPLTSNDTSFVIGKGSKFAVCLREKESNNLHDFNTLQFVFLHEITHIGTIEYGHGKEFWTMFKFILIQAVMSGLYIPYNYKKNNVYYCGLKITSNPYYDYND